MEILTHLLIDEVCPGLHLALGSIQKDHPEDILTSKGQRRCSAFKNERRKQEYISARLLLKELSDRAGLDSDSLEVRKDELGKPYGIYQEKRLFMSLAHTETKVLCALSEEMDIGVDMEPAERRVDRRLRARILHPEEESLEHIELIRLWTIKEAVAKLLGSGLRTNFNELIIHQEEKKVFLARFNDENTARICSFLYQDHWISVAYFI